MTRREEPYHGADEMMEVPEGKRLFMARRKQQKRLKKDVYDRRKEFFMALHAGEADADADTAGASGLSDVDRRKARRVRKRSSGK